MAKMRNATFTTTVPHLYLPETALNAESNSYTVTLCFNVHETFQIKSIELHNCQ